MSDPTHQLWVVAGGKNGRVSKKFKTCNAGALKRCLSKVRISYGWLCSAGCLAGLRWSSFNSGHRGDIIGWILIYYIKSESFFSFDQFRHFLISLSLSLSVRPSCRHHHHSQGCGCILAGNKASALQPLDKVSPAKNMLFLINSEARSTATLIILPPRNLKFLILEFVIGSVNYCGKGPKCICKVSITDHKRNNFEALSFSFSPKHW